MDSQKAWITVRYLGYLALVDSSDVLVVPMCTYDLLCGIAWFHKQNPAINWAQLTTLHSPSASAVEDMTPMTTTVALKVSEAENDNVMTSFCGWV